MAGFEGDWSPYPETGNDHAERAASDDTPVTGQGARVTRLGAICDLATPGADERRSQSFSVSEYALLENGGRVILHDERGFTIGAPTGHVRDGMTLDVITRTVLNVVLPDDAEESEDEHPWSWLAELARARGLDVTTEGLQRLPYDVVLTESVIRWVAPS